MVLLSTLPSPRLRTILTVLYLHGELNHRISASATGMAAELQRRVRKRPLDIHIFSVFHLLPAQHATSYVIHLLDSSSLFCRAARQWKCSKFSVECVLPPV